MSQIKLKNISKSYRKKSVLSNIDATFCSGRITAVLGLNGVGKSTLLNILVGNNNPDSGCVYFNGCEIKEVDKVCDVVLIPDKIILPKYLRIKDIEEIYLKRNHKFDRSYIVEVIELLEIDENQVIKNLSKGGQELVQIAFLTANKPSFIVMDEPLAAIDIIKRKYIIKKLIDLQIDGVGIILSTHIVSEVKDLITDITVLKNNQLSEIIDIDQIFEDGFDSVDDYLSQMI